LKTCKTCGESKPLGEFYKAAGYAGGVKPHCKPCQLELGRGYRASETSEQRRERWVKHKYGVSKEEYATMVASSAGLCDICEQPVVSPSVDHDHATGRVRGLLCDSCNRGIGCFKDNPEVLAAASAYLKRF
jgi:hypothetical protein